MTNALNTPHFVEVEIPSDGHHLTGILHVPMAVVGTVVFAHGSGSGRFSPRNQYVAGVLNSAGIATLLLDLLTLDEESDRRNVFDVDLLARRVQHAVQWAQGEADIGALPFGLFGASTGAAAALVAAALAPKAISAVVSRGGRPDLAGQYLPMVHAPTLLLVGDRDDVVIELNEIAFAQLQCEKQLVLIPGATHLFEEPGTLEEVARLAAEWFENSFGSNHKSLK